MIMHLMFCYFRKFLFITYLHYRDNIFYLRGIHLIKSTVVYVIMLIKCYVCRNISCLLLIICELLEILFIKLITRISRKTCPSAGSD